MKQASDDLLALINGGAAGTAQMFDFDLYSITPSGTAILTAEDGTPLTDELGNPLVVDGSIISPIYFTTADFDILWGGVTYRSGGIRVDEQNSKVQAHWKVGIDSDQWTVVVMPRLVDVVSGATFPDTIGPLPWIQGAQGGLLDAADFQVDRAFFSSMPTWPMTPGGAVPTGVISGIFAGVVGHVDTTNLSVTVTVNDYRSLFATQMPRHYFQAQCRHTLFDVGCTLNADLFAVNGTTIGGSTLASIAQNLAAPGGSGTYLLGTIKFTTGQNAGLWRMITGWNGVGQPFTLLDPFPFPVASGDAFTAYPGCNKTQAACTAFGNILNFGGQPYVPLPETAG